jgi:hypothetical protein
MRRHLPGCGGNEKAKQTMRASHSSKSFFCSGSLVWCTGEVAREFGVPGLEHLVLQLGRVGGAWLTYSIIRSSTPRTFILDILKLLRKILPLQCVDNFVWAYVNAHVGPVLIMPWNSHRQLNLPAGIAFNE